MPTYCGIDPGANGAIALLTDKPMYVTLDTGDPHSIAEHLRGLKTIHTDLFVGIERVSSFPGMSRPGAFSFGGSFKAPQAVCAALGIPFVVVPPREWQKGMSLPKSSLGIAKAAGTKDEDRVRAVQVERKGRLVEMAQARWPSVEWPGDRRRCSAIADAFFLALYVSRTENAHV